MKRTIVTENRQEFTSASVESDDLFEKLNNDFIKEIIIFLAAEALNTLQGKGLRVMTRKFDEIELPPIENNYRFSEEVVSMFEILLKIRKIISPRYPQFSKELTFSDLIEQHQTIFEENREKFNEYRKYSIRFETKEERDGLFTSIFLQKKEA